MALHLHFLIIKVEGVIMAEATLNAKKRENIGKKAVKEARKNGLVPAEYYHRNSANHHLLIDAKEFETRLPELHGLLEINVEDEKKKLLCVLKDLQRDPLNGDVLHIDFQGVKRGEKLIVHVPVAYLGVAAGVKAGGILEHLIREVEVECLPKDIPEKIEIDVSALNVGDAIHVRDLKLENVKVLDDPDETILLIERSRVGAEEEEEEVEEEMLEPELVTSRKKEEEE